MVHRVQPVISSYPPLSLRPDSALQVHQHTDRGQGELDDSVEWPLRLRWRFLTYLCKKKTHGIMWLFVLGHGLSEAVEEDLPWVVAEGREPVGKGRQTTRLEA